MYKLQMTLGAYVLWCKISLLAPPEIIYNSRRQTEKRRYLHE